jgi:hypothetical protein
MFSMACLAASCGETPVLRTARIQDARIDLLQEERADELRSPSVRLGCCVRETTANPVACHLTQGTVLVQVSKNFQVKN